MKGLTPALRLVGATKQFPTRTGPVSAVDGVTLSVATGETVALLGPNGAGKTTLFDLVCGLTRPTSGKVRVLGRPPRRAVSRGDLAAVLQTGGLLRDLTVGETVRLIAALYRRPGRAETVLIEAGLAELVHRRVGRCSGGEQQRLKYALALIPDPQILVLDEPTAGLDRTGRAELWDHVRRRVRQGTTVIYSTHYLNEIAGLAERVFVLRAGRIVGQSTVADLTGPTAARVVHAQLPDAEVAGRASARLSRLDGVRDTSPGGAQVRLVADLHRSDEVAARLLNDFRATHLTVTPQPLEVALARLIEAGE